MMTVMQRLAALAIVLGSLGAAVAQDTGSKSPAGPTILVPTPSSVAEPVSGGGPAPDVAAGPGHPRQPTIISSAFSDYGWLPLKYASLDSTPLKETVKADGQNNFVLQLVE